MISSVIPYAAQKATPVLFQAPNADEKRSNLAFESGFTQILTLPAEKPDASIHSRGQEYLEAAKREKGFVDAWTGVGIEDASISWVAILGWKDTEVSFGANLTRNDYKADIVIRCSTPP